MGMHNMILAIDVDYTNNHASVAAIRFHHWQDKQESAVYKSTVNNVAAYESGNFYRRELPCILHVLNEHHLTPNMIVIDGFVWLDGDKKRGLGAHLYHALDKQVPIIGVAKKAFSGIPEKYALLRGTSKKPLFITSAGIDVEQAISHIRTMAGEHRLPILLKKVDRLCREGND